VYIDSNEKIIMNDVYFTFQNFQKKHNFNFKNLLIKKIHILYLTLTTGKPQIIIYSSNEKKKKEFHQYTVMKIVTLFKR